MCMCVFVCLCLFAFVLCISVYGFVQNIPYLCILPIKVFQKYPVPVSFGLALNRLCCLTLYELCNDTPCASLVRVMGRLRLILLTYCRTRHRDKHGGILFMIITQLQLGQTGAGDVDVAPMQLARFYHSHRRYKMLCLDVRLLLSYK